MLTPLTIYIAASVALFIFALIAHFRISSTNAVLSITADDHDTFSHNINMALDGEIRTKLQFLYERCSMIETEFARLSDLDKAKGIAAGVQSKFDRELPAIKEQLERLKDIDRNPVALLPYGSGSEAITFRDCAADFQQRRAQPKKTKRGAKR